MTAPAACGSCGAPIWWASMRGTNTPTPIADDPDAADGNLAVSRNPFGELDCRPLVEPLRPGEHRARSHFADCPNADEHRKPRRTVAIVCGRGRGCERIEIEDGLW